MDKFNTSLMDPSSSRQSDTALSSKLAKERQHLKNLVDRAADEDDPLSPYEQYVNWLVGHEVPITQEINYELLEVLERAVRSLKSDDDYKNDIRYLKLWLLYAKRVEKPDVVYSYLLRSEIGGIYPLLYEDYALFFEHQNR